MAVFSFGRSKVPSEYFASRSVSRSINAMQIIHLGRVIQQRQWQGEHEAILTRKDRDGSPSVPSEPGAGTILIPA